MSTPGAGAPLSLSRTDLESRDHLASPDLGSFVTVRVTLGPSLVHISAQSGDTHLSLVETPVTTEVTLFRSSYWLAAP